MNDKTKQTSKAVKGWRKWLDRPLTHEDTDRANFWSSCAVGEALHLNPLSNGGNYYTILQNMEARHQELTRMGNEFHQAVKCGDNDRARRWLDYIEKYVAAHGGSKALRNSILSPHND